MEEVLRKCLTCGVEAKSKDDLPNFANVPKGRTAKFGKLNRCNPCQNLYHREYRKRVPKKTRQERRRKNMLKEKYNMKVSDYHNLLSTQGHKCGICDKTQDQDDKTFCVDHNHNTLEIRGILCNNCNSALGKFGDSVKNLKSAISYLEDKGSYSSP